MTIKTTEVRFLKVWCDSRRGDRLIDRKPGETLTLPEVLASRLISEGKAEAAPTRKRRIKA